MARRYIPVTGQEFIAKFIAGERDFSRVQLPTGCELYSFRGYNKLTEPNAKPLILEGADLCGLCAPGINLSRANLASADLMGAILNGAKLAEANLDSAVLRSAELNGTYNWSANFQRADLSSARMQHSYCENASLRGANLAYSDLHSTDFEGADFRRAYLKEAKLAKADLTKANFEGAIEMDSTKGLGSAILLNTFIDYSVWPGLLEQRPVLSQFAL